MRIKLKDLGYIYVISNSFYQKNIYKIGKTRRSPLKRVEEISSATGVPSDFNIEICYQVQDVDYVEKMVHRWLENKGLRINNNREFFHAPLNVIKEVISSIDDNAKIVSYNEIQNNKKTQQYEFYYESIPYLRILYSVLSIALLYISMVYGLFDMELLTGLPIYNQGALSYYFIFIRYFVPIGLISLFIDARLFKALNEINIGYVKATVLMAISIFISIFANFYRFLHTSLNNSITITFSIFIAIWFTIAILLSFTDNIVYVYKWYRIRRKEIIIWK